MSEGKFDEKTANWYFRQLVDGVQYCHDQGVCHRDLKPENLLIGEKDKRLKISGSNSVHHCPSHFSPSLCGLDFGLSVLYHPESQADLLHTTCGTPNYVAPEVCLRSVLFHQSDLSILDPRCWLIKGMMEQLLMCGPWVSSSTFFSQDVRNSKIIMSSRCSIS